MHRDGPAPIPYIPCIRLKRSSIISVMQLRVSIPVWYAHAYTVKSIIKYNIITNCISTYYTNYGALCPHLWPGRAATSDTYRHAPFAISTAANAIAVTCHTRYISICILYSRTETFHEVSTGNYRGVFGIIRLTRSYNNDDDDATAFTTVVVADRHARASIWEEDYRFVIILYAELSTVIKSKKLITLSFVYLFSRGYRQTRTRKKYIISLYTKIIIQNIRLTRVQCVRGGLCRWTNFRFIIEQNNYNT